MSGATTAGGAPGAGASSWTPPWTALGFLPDAPAFAMRTGAAFVLAYAVAFYAQVDSASSAGICVALVAQPAFGMSFSKAVYRMAGTLLGAVAALVLLALFPQDRTMLLLGYAVWLGLCTVVGTLLRDFRAYGAVLSGYTAGIIAIGAIDSPDQGLLTALDRVAAIAIGIGCVLLVNAATGSPRVLNGLDGALRRGRDELFARAAGVLGGGAMAQGAATLGVATEVTALRSQATFAGLELPDGARRINGARHTLAALLRTATLLRMMEAVIAAGATPAWRDWLRRAARALEAGTVPDGVPPPAHGAVELVLLEGTAELLALWQRAENGLRTLSGEGQSLPDLRLRAAFDVPGALLNAIRSTVALGLCCCFVVLAGWPGATLLLIQSSAIIALLGAAPNPTAGSLPFVYVLPPMMLLVGAAKFLALPLASGFVPFALICFPLMAAAAAMQRHPRLQPFAMPAMLYVALLLSPSNPQTFDLVSFMNTGMELGVAMVFVAAVFHLILPVSPPRRLMRVAGAILRDGPASASLLFDRLAQARLWAGYGGREPRPTRRRLLDQLECAGEVALLRTRAATLLGRAVPEGEGLAAAEQLLAGPDGVRPGVRRAAALLAGAALLERGTPGVARLRRRVLG